MKRRTKPIGPISASTSAAAPKTSFQSHTASNPNSLSQSRPAAVAITISSKIDQPRHWITFRPVATYEPCRPSGARWSTIDGTRPSAPISAAIASIELPIRPPTSVARSASFSDRSKYAGRTSTSSDTPRLSQSSVVSPSPSTRSRSGTGSMPQLGALSAIAAARLPALERRVVRAADDQGDHERREQQPVDDEDRVRVPPHEAEQHHDREQPGARGRESPDEEGAGPAGREVA